MVDVSIADDPLERVRRFIDSGCGASTTWHGSASEPFSLDRLADEAGLSAYHFSRQFSARFGISPMAYVRLITRSSRSRS